MSDARRYAVWPDPLRSLHSSTMDLLTVPRTDTSFGHEPLKVGIPSIFKTYLLRHLQWELASDH